MVRHAETSEGKSESGYTHLIVRGIGRQILFEAREDYQFYLARCARIVYGESGTVLQSYDKAKRNKVLTQLLRDGLSIRQIERLTGISRGVIQGIKT